MSAPSYPRITVGIPSNGYIRSETTVCLVSAIANTKNVLFRLSNPTGCYIHQNRENIVLEAQKEKSTHLMFIDSDMIFPPHAISQLVSLDKPISGANYNHRDNTGKSVIRLDPTQHSANQLNIAKNTATITDPQKPFKCLALGTGFMLIQMWVFDKLPQPWFFFEPSSGPQGMIGEDIWFCNLAKKHNIDIWCDPTIPIDHIGVAYY
jgi:hypothetical protein